MPNICNKCGSQFATRPSLMQHVQAVHPRTHNTPSTAPQHSMAIVPTAPSAAFTCSVCGSVHGSYARLQEHLTASGHRTGAAARTGTATPVASVPNATTAVITSSQKRHHGPVASVSHATTAAITSSHQRTVNHNTSTSTSTSTVTRRSAQVVQASNDHGAGAAATSARVRVDILAYVDTSSSMHGQPLRDCQEAVRSLFHDMGAHDSLMLASFSNNVRTLIPLRNKHKSIGHTFNDGLAQLKGSGCTALWDAICEGARETTVKHNERGASMNRAQALVVLTDGQDNASRHTSADAHTALASLPSTKNVQAFLIGVGATAQAALRSIVPTGKAARGVHLIDAASVADIPNAFARVRREIQQIRIITTTEVTTTTTTARAFGAAPATGNITAGLGALALTDGGPGPSRRRQQLRINACH